MSLKEYTPNSKKELNDTLKEIFTTLFYHIGYVHGYPHGHIIFINSKLGRLEAHSKESINLIVTIHGNKDEIMKYCLNVIEWYNRNNKHHSVGLDRLKTGDYEFRLNNLYNETDRFDSYEESDDSKLDCPF